MTGAQFDSMGTDARSPEHMVGDESRGPETQTPLREEFVFGSNTEECAASRAGSIHPSLEGTTHSGASPER